MELGAALARRRMVRSFATIPVDPAVVDGLLASTRRAPSAGNTRATAWLVLNGPEQTRVYWEHATTPEWRDNARRWPGLSRAPVIALSLTSPEAYLSRYAEADKSGSGLGRTPTGGGARSWPVPYWFADAAFETMIVLLGAADEALGACFLGNFRSEAPLLGALGVPEGWRLFGAVLLGRPDGRDHPSPSLARPEPPWRRIHHGRWQ